MFGAPTNAFGQASSSPFGSQSVFGQPNSATTNPFAPKPFGSTSPFGSQTGNSTVTGMFGAPQTSSPFGLTPTFGASSSPAFGSSVPAFGVTSTPTFGASSSAFGGSSTFGQKPTFGGFGSTAQANPFGSASQSSQPSFGTGLFGSSNIFGSQSQSAFGAATTPSFGSTSTPSFGTTPAFGATPSAFGASSSANFGSAAFGSTGSGFGSSATSLFGSGNAFGTSTNSVFGSSTAPAFGASSTPAFGTPNAPAFGTSSPAFGASTNTAFGTPFGASSTPSFNFSSSPTFGQTTPSFGVNPFGSTSTTFGAQTSSFGSQQTTPFGSSGFGQTGIAGSRGGSRVTAYTPTTEADATGQPGKLDSISAMPVYKDKSHEELRWEDYQLGDKGGSAPPSQAWFTVTSTQPSSSSAPTSISQPLNPFPTSNPLSFNKPITNPFSSSSPFAPSSSSPAFSNITPSSSTGMASAFVSTPLSNPGSSLFPALNLSNSQTSLPTAIQPPGQTNSPINLFNTSVAPSSIFPNSTPGGGGLFSSTSSFPSSTNTGVFNQSNPMPLFPSAPTSTFNFNTMSQTQPALTPCFPSQPGFSLNNAGQQLSTQSAAGMQPVPVSPYGNLPPMPQMSIGQGGTTSVVEYGLSSKQAADRPAPVRISSLLISRHLSQRRIRLHARKYHPKHDSSKVQMFNEEDEIPSTPKADALFIPRENPRALIIQPIDYWKLPKSGVKTPQATDANGRTGENGTTEANEEFRNSNENPEAVLANIGQEQQNHALLVKGKVGSGVIEEVDFQSLIPKLKSSEYYTEPSLLELEERERKQPGFLSHVKDFVVGRHGYGSIRFMGHTDVRKLDLESLVQFSSREVVVYMDDSQKPSVGEGLNKPAEVTLLRIKCFDKKTGIQYTEGPKIERYKEMLKRKAEEQGAEFVSYDPVKGEWKFKVNHFSKYGFGEDQGL